MLKRKLRKTMRLSEAATVLQESSKTVRRRIDRKELTAAYMPPLGSTSPIKVYEAEVYRIAEQIGVI